jgi:hypothetical protein
VEALNYFKKLILGMLVLLMGAFASKKIMDMGYASVYDVTGGMIAWQAAGYQLLDDANK